LPTIVSQQNTGALTAHAGGGLALSYTVETGSLHLRCEQLGKPGCNPDWNATDFFSNFPKKI
jgi:hypothetical protein